MYGFFNKIFNESCLETIKCIHGVDVVLTSPFYNTAGSTVLDGRKSKANQYARYDTQVDVMSDEEYCDFTVELFNGLNNVLKDDGTILYNISYSTNNSNGFILAISDIIRRTNFSMVDMISWKKENCIPNVSSPNRLTRIVEPVFVFCKKGHEKTFYANKPIMPQKKSPHIVYKSIPNIIEAKTSDGKCPYNKATYSTDLCRKLLNIYAPKNGVVYDPFMGSGTTAVTCVQMGLKYIGSEISSKQVEYANERIAKYTQGLIRFANEEVKSIKDRNILNSSIEKIAQNEELYKLLDRDFNGMSFSELVDLVGKNKQNIKKKPSSEGRKKKPNIK